MCSKCLLLFNSQTCHSIYFSDNKNNNFTSHDCVMQPFTLKEGCKWDC
jgi:hypothetical protein